MTFIVFAIRQSLINHTVVRVIEDVQRNPRVYRAGKEIFRRGIDFHPADSIFQAFALHGDHEGFLMDGVQQAVGVNLATDGPRGVQRDGFVAAPVRLHHVLGVLQGVFDLLPEPVVNTLRKQTAREAHQQERRNQGETDEGRDQLGPEAGS